MDDEIRENEYCCKGMREADKEEVIDYCEPNLTTIDAKGWAFPISYCPFCCKKLEGSIASMERITNVAKEYSTKFIPKNPTEHKREPMGSKERESISSKFNSPDIPKWKKELITEVEESMKKHGKNDFYGVHDLYGAICLIEETQTRAITSTRTSFRDDVLRLKNSVLDFVTLYGGIYYGDTVREVREEIAKELDGLLASLNGEEEKENG